MAQDVLGNAHRLSGHPSSDAASQQHESGRAALASYSAFQLTFKTNIIKDASLLRLLLCQGVDNEQDGAPLQGTRMEFFSMGKKGLPANIKGLLSAFTSR